MQTVVIKTVVVMAAYPPRLSCWFQIRAPDTILPSWSWRAHPSPSSCNKKTEGKVSSPFRIPPKR